MKSTTLVALTLTCVLATPLNAQDKRVIEIDGANVAYRDVGQGEPLLLLHGFGANAGMWDPVVGDLSAQYRLIIPDLRGHGESTNPVDYFTHRDAAGDVFGLLDALDITQVRAVGFSSGGMVLLHMATAQPDRFGALALVGATPYLPEGAREIMRGIDAEGMSMAELDAVGLVHGDTAQARLLVKQFVDFEDSYTDVNFTPPLLSTITAPTLVIHGDRDPFFPVSIPAEVYRTIPNAFLLVFPNFGHEPFPRDSAGQRYYTDVLLRFFEGAWN